jgi:hypothetical protein
MAGGLALLLAVLIALLSLAALGAMAAGELSIAGVCFLFASFAIYLRETRT